MTRTRIVALLCLGISMTTLHGCNAIQSLLGVQRGTLVPVEDDRVAVEQPAQLFYVEAPSTASANVEFTLSPWVLLAPGTSGSLPKFGLLSAQVDPINHTITVSGKSTRFDLKHDATPPARVSPTTAATQSITATASAGTYEIRIAADSFVSEVPPLTDWNGNPLEHPQPMATRSITIE